jgi:hypothetical protein
MLIRICLIVAVVAGLAVGTLNFWKVREKIISLQDYRERETQRADTAEADLARTRSELADTTQQLKQTTAELQATTVADVRRLTDENEQLMTNLQRVTGERDTAQAELARYVATGLNPEQIITANNRIKELENNLEGTRAENRFLGQKILKLENALARYVSPEKPVVLPASLRGTVVASDPKWNFVVIDIGENQGVLENGELLVNRNGKLVGKVVIRNVQKDRSVANVMPGWTVGEVLEGDQVIPAHPAS